MTETGPMFIKIPIYFELTGQVKPEEVQELVPAWQKELTRQISSEIRTWRKFDFKISDRKLCLELRTAASVQKSIVTNPPAPTK